MHNAAWIIHDTLLIIHTTRTSVMLNIGKILRRFTTDWKYAIYLYFLSEYLYPLWTGISYAINWYTYTIYTMLEGIKFITFARAPKTCFSMFVKWPEKERATDLISDWLKLPTHHKVIYYKIHNCIMKVKLKE